MVISVSWHNYYYTSTTTITTTIVYVLYHYMSYMLLLLPSLFLIFVINMKNIYKYFCSTVTTNTTDYYCYAVTSIFDFYSTLQFFLGFLKLKLGPPF